MNTNYKLRNRRLLSVFVGVVIIFSVLGNPSSALAAGWSTEAVISPSLPVSTPNAFAFNPSGNEVWVTAPLGSSFNVTVEAAQRTFPGAWSSLVTIASVRGTSVQSLSVSLSANNYAAAVWLVGGGVQIALRSPAGAWQAPVSLASDGNVLNVRARLDALGNGTAVWSRLTSTVAVVEAVTWTASGAFSNVVQLSPSSHGAFLPDLAVNEAGTAVAVWQAAGLLDNSNPYQVESATRLAGGNWSAVSTVSPVVPQTWTPRVTLDGSGNATVVWEQGATVNNYRIYAATRPAGGAWGSQIRIEPADWNFAGQNSVDSDAAGNVTATWVVEDTSGVMSIHTATRSASSGAWGSVTSLGQCRTITALCLFPQVSAARDGSITVVGWGAYGVTRNNVAVRLGSGAWTPMVVGSSNPQLTYVLATNNAQATAVWPAYAGVLHHVVLKQSDYR